MKKASKTSKQTFATFKDLGQMKKEIECEDEKKDNAKYEKKSEAMKDRGMYHPKMKK